MAQTQGEKYPLVGCSGPGDVGHLSSPEAEDGHSPLGRPHFTDAPDPSPDILEFWCLQSPSGKGHVLLCTFVAFAFGVKSKKKKSWLRPSSRKFPSWLYVFIFFSCLGVLWFQVALSRLESSLSSFFLVNLVSGVVSLFGKWLTAFPTIFWRDTAFPPFCILGSDVANWFFVLFFFFSPNREN